MSSLFIRGIAVLVGVWLIAWVAVCIRRGKLPVGAGLRKDYFLRGHDAVAFWVLCGFYLALGIAIILAAYFRQ